MKNIIFLDYLLRIKNRKNNRYLERLQEKFAFIDSINEPEKLLDEINKINLYNKQMIQYKCVNKESLFYGHSSALLDYAGFVKNTKPVYMPAIEHGINFSEDFLPKTLVDISPSFIFQGKYKNSLVREMTAVKPIYNIGPYILYAKDYYSEERIKEIHQKNGRTVVYFLFHTFENNNQMRSFKKNIELFKKQYGSAFDKLIICVYWLDLSLELLEVAQKENVTIVSAGARFDVEFIKRLRTIINLADMVIGDDIGSYIGYAIALGKEIGFIQTVSHDSFISNPNQIYKRNRSMIISAIQTKSDELYKIYNKFWGSIEDFKTPDEMGDILERTQELVKHRNI